MSALEELFYSKVLLQSAARFADCYHADLLSMVEADRNVLKCKVYVQEEDCRRYNNEERDGVRRILSTGGYYFKVLHGFLAAWVISFLCSRNDCYLTELSVLKTSPFQTHRKDHEVLVLDAKIRAEQSRRSSRTAGYHTIKCTVGLTTSTYSSPKPT